MVGRLAIKKDYIEAQNKGTTNLLQSLKKEGAVLLAPQGELIIFGKKNCKGDI